MKLPLELKFRLILKYGISNAFVAFKIYEKIYEQYYQRWKDENWRYLLEYCRFNSKPSSENFNGMLYVDWDNDFSWKNAKKRKMSKERWRLLSLKEVPNERPKELGWNRSQKLECLQYEILPSDYGEKTGLFPKQVLETTSLMAQMSNLESPEQMAMFFELRDIKLTSIDIACMIFMFWIGNLALECNEKCWAWKISLNTYANFISMLKMTNIFDEQLRSKDFKKAMEVFCIWYKKKHAVTGMFAVVDPHSSYPHSSYFKKKDGTSWECEHCYENLTNQIDEILRSKENRS